MSDYITILKSHMGAKRLQGIKQGEENRIKSAHKIQFDAFQK